MLSVQAAVHTDDYSFDLYDPKIGKSVESDNLQGKNTFKDIFEAASSDNANSQNSPEITDIQRSNGSVEKNTDRSSLHEDPERIKPEENKDKSKPDKIKLPETSKDKVNQDNKKLLSLKKVKSGDLHNKAKNEKTIASIKNHPSPSKLGNVTETKKSSVVDKSDLGIESPEVHAKVVESSHISNLIHISIEFSGKAILEKTGSSTLPISVNGEKKGAVKKKSSEKKEIPAGKAKISVLDLRQSEARTLKAKHTSSTMEKDGQKLTFEQAERISSDNSNDSKPIVIELTHIKDHFSGESKTLTTSSGSALMKQLEESINNRIVKQSSVILKDSSAGEIKLILKPEQLGNVRIKLNMHDNRISGSIIVDNVSVKEIFEQNMQNLERAFRENGFETANLDVSVGGDNSGSSGRENSSDIKKQIKMIDESIPSVYSESENLIDLIA